MPKHPSEPKLSALSNEMSPKAVRRIVKKISVITVRGLTFFYSPCMCLSCPYASNHIRHDLFRTCHDLDLMSNFQIYLLRSSYLSFEPAWWEKYNGAKILTLASIDKAWWAKAHFLEKWPFDFWPLVWPLIFDLKTRCLPLPLITLDTLVFFCPELLAQLGGKWRGGSFWPFPELAHWSTGPEPARD